MIKQNEVIYIGYISKTHGVHGEVDLAFSDDIFDNDNLEYLVIDIDGIFVPFFVDSYRFRSNEVALIIFQDIDSSDKAEDLVGKKVYFPKEHLSKEDLEDINLDGTVSKGFEGYNVYSENNEFIGKIIEIDDSTINTLLLIEKDNNRFYIPLVEEYIIEIKSDSIIMDLPDGLLDIN